MTENDDEICKRAEKYAEVTKKVLDEVKERLKEVSDRNLNFSKLIDAVQRYLGDARYFLDKKDCATALIATSYAEGLLDSLRYLDVLEVPWRLPYEKKKVFVAGTFEIVHPGHLRLLEYASKLGDVYVVIARDSNVEKIKGRRPLISENERLKVIKAIRYVKEAFLGDQKDFLKSVRKIRPDIILLGPDQKFDEEKLAETVYRRFGFRPIVIRFPKKEPFNDKMYGVRDIYRKVCERICEKL